MFKKLAFTFFLASGLLIFSQKNIFASCSEVPSNQTTCTGTQTVTCSQAHPPAGNIDRWCCDTQTDCDNAKKGVQNTITSKLVGSTAFPELSLPCENDNPNGDKGADFNSLRPYQAAPCGTANLAYYCSNDLIFNESFKMEYHGDCKEQLTSPGSITFTCDPKHYVDPHLLYVQLDNSNLPILGNTELVTNSQKNADTIDDATKVNEYASWYLSGVNTRAEYGTPTNKQIVDYSGPVQKLLPQAIAEAQRTKVVEDSTKKVPTTQPQEVDNQNHNQIVVCSKKSYSLPLWLTNFLGTGSIGIGNDIPTECYTGDNSTTASGTVWRLKDWQKTNTLQSVANDAIDYLKKVFPNDIATQVLGSTLSRWPKSTPPLPWSDEKGKPFATNMDYQKAYNEWRGEACAILPNPFTKKPSLVCLGLWPIINNPYADLFPYVPLSENVDKGGLEKIDTVQISPGAGTQIKGQKYSTAISPPLYFAHTEEVKQLSELLNKTYIPKGVKSAPLPKTTETNSCSVVNIRTNQGDNLFPGDAAKPQPDELQVQGVEYTISQATCNEVWTRTECGTDIFGYVMYCDSHTLKCPADVTITINTSTLTPNVDEIFSTTVADSASTFRKIYPKVEAGAPVTCIADIPTVTDVTYDPLIGIPGKSQRPTTGELTFKVDNQPSDGTNTTPQLTFPHIGSVYDYFLKGIQTALRPQGFADPSPISGTNCADVAACGELPKNLPKGCSLGSISSRVGNIPQSLKDIVEAAATTYNTPPNLILGIMFGEGLFAGGNQKDWTDTNVKNWATCQKVPGCNETGDDNFMGFNGNDFANIAPHIKADILKLDPTRKSLSQCNLLDAIYAMSWNLHDSADGGGGLPATCYGIALKAPVPSSCSWTDSQYESAIKISESGYTNACFTLKGSCAGGGGLAATCPGGDVCEKNGGSGNTSHNACVWEVAHGQ